MPADPAARGQRRRKTASERREQYARAEARVTASLLRGFAAIRNHRGGQLTHLDQAMEQALLHARTGIHRTGAPTKLCWHFARGHCNRGPACCFKHEVPYTDHSGEDAVAAQDATDRCPSPSCGPSGAPAQATAMDVEEASSSSDTEAMSATASDSVRFTVATYLREQDTSECEFHPGFSVQDIHGQFPHLTTSAISTCLQCMLDAGDVFNTFDDQHFLWLHGCGTEDEVAGDAPTLQSTKLPATTVLGHPDEPPDARTSQESAHVWNPHAASFVPTRWGSDSTQVKDLDALIPGQDVIITGLRSPASAHLNGTTGKVQEFHVESGRYIVSFSPTDLRKDWKRIRRANLIRMLPDTSDDADTDQTGAALKLNARQPLSGTTGEGSMSTGSKVSESSIDKPPEEIVKTKQRGSLSTEF
jgi:hypothetical protein